MSDEVLSQEEIEALISQGAQSQGDASAAADASAELQVIAQEAAPEPAIDTAAARQQESVIRPMDFSPVVGGAAGGSKTGVDLILDVQLQVTVELGRAVLTVKDVLALGPGSVVELDKHAGEPVEVVVNNKTVARGEVVVIDENFGVRITEIVNAQERSARAKAA